MKRLLLMLFVLSEVAFAQQINPNQVNWATPITSPVTFGNAVNAPMINAVQIVGLGSNTTIQAAITAAGATGAVIILRRMRERTLSPIRTAYQSSTNA